MVDSVDAHDGVTEAFTDLAGWAEGSSPLYERICRIVSDDPDLLELAGTVPRTARQPTSSSPRFTSCYCEAQTIRWPSTIRAWPTPLAIRTTRSATTSATSVKPTRTDLLAAFEQHGDWVEWRPR